MMSVLLCFATTLVIFGLCRLDVLLIMSVFVVSVLCVIIGCIVLMEIIMLVWVWVVVMRGMICLIFCVVVILEVLGENGILSILI